MKIEIKETSGSYYYTDIYGVETMLTTPPKIEQDNIADAIKLKDAGFTSEEVFRLLRKDK